MRKSLILFYVGAIAAITPTPLAHGDPALAELVTPMRLDTRSGEPNLKQWRDVERDKPLGQTFTTSANAKRLCRIAVAVPGWHESWTEDESLTLTLYDSPAKQTRITSYSMPYKWRRWEGSIMMFPLWCPIEPGRSYYFEITVTGGDGLIRGIGITSKAYENGEAYLAGQKQPFDFFFETHTKADLNPEADYGRLFALWDLEYPGLEKVKDLVRRKQWEAASYALVDYYENHRPDLMEKRRVPATGPAGFTTREGELALEQKVLADGGTIEDFGPDWNHYAIWPTRGGVGLTRGGVRKFIAWAYAYTGDRKYAKLWNDINYACMRDQPNPVEAGVYSKIGPLHPAPPAGISGGTMWHSLSIGPRASFGFVYYHWFLDCPEFTPDTRAGFIFNLADMADVLLRHKAGGNWTTQIKSCLITLAEQHPEWAKSKLMMKDGFDGMVENLLETVHLDGPLKEATPNYHLLTLNRFVKLLETGEKHQLAIPDEARQRVLKAAEYSAFSILPDFSVPVWGDSNPVTKPTDALKRPAELFQRDDLLWVASEGAAGKPPTFTSIAFPTAGYFIMRSDWSPQARYLALHNGHSTSHGHFDALGLTVAAFGRPLILDPGIYIYGTPDSARLIRTASHSTVTITNRDTINANGQNAFLSTRAWDYFSGVNAGYQGLKETKHRRRIIFAKPDYWVIQDTLMGPADGPITCRFVLPDTQAEQDRHIIRTTDANSANIAIIPADPATKAKITPMKRAGSWERLTDCSVAEFTPADASWCTVLVPMPAGQRADAQVQVLKGDAGQALSVTRGQASDLFVFQDADLEGVYGDGLVKLTGESAIFRRPGDVDRALSARSCRSFSWNGQELFSSKQAADIEIRWTGRQIAITAPSGCKVHSTGVTSAIINGSEVLISGKADFLVVP